MNWASISLTRGHWFALHPNQWIFTKRKRTKIEFVARPGVVSRQPPSERLDFVTEPCHGTWWGAEALWVRIFWGTLRLGPGMSWPTGRGGWQCHSRARWVAYFSTTQRFALSRPGPRPSWSTGGWPCPRSPALKGCWGQTFSPVKCLLTLWLWWSSQWTYDLKNVLITTSSHSSYLGPTVC